MLTRSGQVVGDVNEREGQVTCRTRDSCGGFFLILLPDPKFETCLTKEIGKDCVLESLATFTADVVGILCISGADWFPVTTLSLILSISVRILGTDVFGF